MIIQCEQCRTKFRLDDSKIRENGVKVRCAKCRHVFTVRKQQPEEAEQGGFAAVLDQSPVFAGAAAADSSAASRETVAPESRPEQHEETPFATDAGKPEISASDFGEFEPPREEPQAEQPLAEAFSFTAMDAQQEAAPSIQETPPPTHGEIDFGEVDFGLPPEQPAPTDVNREPFPTAEAATQRQPFGDEFSFPATESRQETPSPMQEPPPSTHGEIDFGEVDFGLPPEQPAAADVSREPFPTAEAVPAQEPLPPLDFSFDLPDSGKTGQGQELPTEDAFDFGMELPTPLSEQVQPQAGTAFTFAAPAEAVATSPQPEVAVAAPTIPVQPAPLQPAEVKTTGPVSFEPPVGSVPAPAEPGQEELPPLSIPSRRKSSSTLKLLVALLVVALIGAAAFYGKDLYPKLKQMIVPESGKIMLRSVTSSFVKNSITGSELLVISGEAVNGFTTPRASLQVKGMVYGDKDQVLASKSAYCGNPLSAQQLASMPLDAIELAMGNQVGSGLSNLEVPTGKAIPFTIVIATVPEGAKNIGVVPAGSQTLTDKPK